ncbi:uncharacterized protein [Primulina eburnea]|uniref:uncharacterized protein n=1 Tax=Primulina eburnea TaxID=1245227 RepID=UPI003C6C9260
MAPVTNVSEDSMSPYYIHHSDSLGLVLVSQPLTGDNFTSCHCDMIIAISVKNKLGFVDGSIPRPDDFMLLNSWKRNNGIVTSWILNSVSKDISTSIIFTESALDIRQDLKERFQQSNGPRIFQLRRNHRQGLMTGVKKLESHHQMDYVLAFLMGLNESFSQVFAMIIQEERHRQLGSQYLPTESAHGMALTVKGEVTKPSSGSM